MRMTPETKAYIEQGIASGRGLMILGAHMSNFDLALIGLSQHIPVEMQALSLADPPPGFEFFNQLREKGNVIHHAHHASFAAGCDGATASGRRCSDRCRSSHR